MPLQIGVLPNTLKKPAGESGLPLGKYKAISNFDFKRCSKSAGIDWNRHCVEWRTVPVLAGDVINVTDIFMGFVEMGGAQYKQAPPRVWLMRGNINGELVDVPATNLVKVDESTPVGRSQASETPAPNMASGAIIKSSISNIPTPVKALLGLAFILFLLKWQKII